MNYKMLAAAAAVSLVSLSAGPVLAAHTPEGSEIFVPEPPAGMGQVVFFRPSGPGFVLGCTVKEGDAKVSSLGNGKYFILVTTPGAHEYNVRTEAKDALTVLVEPDETQFVRCKMKMGVMVGRPDISPSTPAEFADKSGKLKLVDDDDMGEGALRAAEIAARQ
jgi:hypothetical protein